MTEVTGRMRYFHALSAMCGVPLLCVAYCHQLGLPLPRVARDWPSGIKWVDEIGDWKSASWYWKQGELGILDWMKNCRGVRRAGLTMWGDSAPAWRTLPLRILRKIGTSLGR